MDSVFKPVDFKAHATTTKTPSFPSGAIKKHRHHPPPPAADQRHAYPYRECLRNHAASLGGHAVDGCGEFLPSPSADPTSLRCDACGCHRNFHRRVPDRTSRRHQAAGRSCLPRQDREAHAVHEKDGTGSDAEREVRDQEVDDDDEDGEGGRQRSSLSPRPHPSLYSSAPHMLMALSSAAPTGGHGPVRQTASLAASGVAEAQPKKKLRTKFSREQKEQMYELSERLGWRMQKDEGFVEECCRGIGVDKGVFKVWMNNNKHQFLLAKKANDISGSSSGGINTIANGNGDDGHPIINGSSSAS